MSKKTQSAGLYVKNQHTQDGNKNRTQTYNDTFLTFLPFLFSALKKLAVVGWLQQYSTSLALEQYCLQLWMAHSEMTLKFGLQLRDFIFTASKAGRCKIYHQLLDICRDMMKTVKKMYGTYMYERYLFAKEKDRFSRKLKRVTKQLELSGNFITFLYHVS